MLKGPRGARRFRTGFSQAQKLEMRRNIESHFGDANRFPIFLMEGISNGAITKVALAAMIPRIRNANNKAFAEKLLRTGFK